MHRSGTSALMRMVNLRGVDLGSNLMAPKADNEIGFWEHMDINQMNEKLLEDLNSSWDDVRPLPEGWWDSDAAQRYKLQIINILERDFAKSPFWGVKDPRICRFLPIWRPLLEQIKCKPYFLIIVRNPLEVVSSLAKRDGFSQGKSCLLWLKHIIESEKGTRNTPRLFVTYEELLSKWKGVMSRVQTSFRFKWPVTLKDASPEIASFLQKSLRHNIVNDSILIEDKMVSRWIKDLYFETKGAVNGDDSQLIKTVTAIEAELKDADGLYEPALADIWERYQANNAMLQERSQQLNDIKIRLEGSSQDRGYHLSTIDNLQTAIKEKNERIQQLNSDLMGLGSKFTSSQETVSLREAQFANLKSKIKEREERIQQLDTEVVALRDQLSTIQQTVVGRKTEVTHLQTANKEKNERNQQLDTEVVALRDQLSTVQQTVVGHETEVAHLQTTIKEKNERIQQLNVDLTDLRSKFTSSQEAGSAREAQFANLQSKVKEREERIQQLDTEVVELRDQLSEVKQTVVRRETEVTHLQTGIKDRDERIQQVNGELTDLRDEFSSFQEVASSREAHFADLHSKVKEMDERIQQLDTELSGLSENNAASKESLAARETEVKNLHIGLVKKDERIHELDAAVARLQDEVDAMRTQVENYRPDLEGISGSTSWRLMSPLRGVYAKFRKVKRKIKIARYLLNRQYRLINKSGLFDVAYYLDQNPDAAKSGIDPLAHYLSCGAGEGSDPNLLFDTSFYLEQNPNIAESGMNPLLHYLKSGAGEGRNPNPLFETSYYLEQNPDVAESQMNPLQHYLKSGAGEGRNPNPLFETSYYLEQNPDIAESGMNPLAHYLSNGAGEGRDPSPLFETSYYLEYNPDVAESGMNPLVHYLRIGAGEGRDPNPLFDTSYYLEHNPDIAESGMNPLIHYLKIGAIEGRDPNPLFDTSYYLEHNPDIAESGMNPLVHYLTNGAVEGRDPNPLFETSYYLEQNPDIAESGLNPLVHYLRNGAVEGRDPSPLFDTSCYLDQNPGVAESGMNPLAHYLKYASIESGKVIKIVPLETKVYHHSDNIELNEYFLSLNGWAVSNNELERIGIYIDDNFIGNAKYGWPRKDIEKAFPSNRNALYSGFTFFSLLDEYHIENNKTYNITVRTLTKDYQSSEHRYSIVSRGYSFKEFTEYILPSSSNLNWMKKVSNNFLNKYHFTMALAITESNIPNIEKTIKSLLSQTYPNYNILLFYENEVPVEILKCFKIEIDESKLQVYAFRDLNKIVLSTKTDFLSFILSGDTIMPQTLFEVAKVLNIDTTIELIYTDESVQSDVKTVRPIFKPGWSPDLLLSKNYIGNFFITKKKLLERLEDFLEFPFPEGLNDLLLKLTEHTDSVYHIPLPLFINGCSHDLNLENNKKLLENALQRRKIKGEIIPLSIPGTFRVKRKIKGNPKVSIIIPTAYKNPIKNIKPCLKSIIEKSTYNNYEIVIVDNSFGKFSLPEIKKIIPDSTNLKIISYEKKFNFSEIYNLAIPQAQGEHCLLLNDDTEVISPDWIEALLENSQRPEVSAVGAKLLYSDKTIQHAGIFLVDSEGGTRHYGRNFEQNSNINNGLLQVTHNCTATTFGCVMISKDVYLRMNGLEPRFPIECNDTDFCLRAISFGYFIVWTPFALLFHKEAATRREFHVTEDVERFWNYWGKKIRAGDKFYNPNLTLESDNFTFNNRPILIEHHEPSITHLNRLNIISSSKPISIESIKKILVIKLDHIGDVILSIPAIKILRKKFPEASITLLSGSWAKTIVESIKEIDDYITFDFFHKKSEKGGCLISDREIKELKNLLFSRHFDLALDLRRHKETRKILKISGATFTVGFSTGEDDSWMTTSLEIPKEDIDIPGQTTKSHISAQLCKLILCIPTNSSFEIQSTLPIIDLPFETDNKILKDHSKLIASNLLIGIHPGAGASIRHWPPTHYASLSDMLIEKKNANIIFFGGKEDKQLVDSIIGIMNHKKNAVSLAGTTTLTEFITVLKKCHLFIGNVSGPGHLSGILGVPTLIIFAGTVLPQEWQPLGEKTLTIRMKLFCAPCYKAIPEHCPIDMKCLKFLWPEKVIGAVNQLLAISN